MVGIFIVLTIFPLYFKEITVGTGFSSKLVEMAGTAPACSEVSYIHLRFLDGSYTLLNMRTIKYIRKRSDF